MHTTLSLHTHNLNGRQTYSSSYESGGGPSEIVTVLLLPKACILYTDSVSKDISLPIQIHSTYQQRLRNTF